MLQDFVCCAIAAASEDGVAALEDGLLR